ncbi:hypothetical protein [Methanomethylovorans sp.]|mgnify:CR=1 FL=1|uniref:hypothetical protein n=1 Tax=Methanomethylovorans sp. TaxID=2758717 RepID=UPI003D123EAB
MKLLKYALLLVVLMSFVSVAVAEQGPGQGLVPHSLQVDKTSYVPGDTVTATVRTQDSMDSVTFTWYEPGDYPFYPVQYAYGIEYPSKTWTDTYTLPINAPAGNWMILACGMKDGKPYCDCITFEVKEGPEFSFGSFIALFLVGGLYLVMRRN